VTIAEPAALEVLVCHQCGREVTGGLRGDLCFSCWLLGPSDPGLSYEYAFDDEGAAELQHTEAEHAWFYLLLSDRDPATFEELLARPAWQERAACRGMGTERFFPGSDGSLAPARAVCAGCPVKVECLDYAVDCGETLAGVWAGTSIRDRRKLRKLSA
jgi:hypothetical protein